MYKVEINYLGGKTLTFNGTQKPVYNINTKMLTILFVDISSTVCIPIDSHCMYYVVHKCAEENLIKSKNWRE